MPNVLFLIVLIVLSVACSKHYIEQESTLDSNYQPITISSDYTSVDFSQISFHVNQTDISKLQVYRSSQNIPISHYDGVFIDSFSPSVKQEIYDDKLSTGVTYYYSIFYETYENYDANSIPIRAIDLTVKTKSYQQGMLQMVNEMIDYANKKNDDFKYMLATKDLQFFFNGSGTGRSFLSTDLFNRIHGVLIPELRFKMPAMNQLDALMNKNNELILDLPSSIKIFAVDYVQNNDEVLRNSDRFTNKNGNVVYFVDPYDRTDIFNDVLYSNSEEIIDLSQVQNFAFFDGSVPLDSRHSDISGYDYDLIIMTPFTKSESNFSFTHMVESSRIPGLKTKSNSVTPRLLFAYIDVSRIWDGGVFWDGGWSTNPTSRPSWVDGSVAKSDADSRTVDYENDYYVKYWRKDWKDHLKQIIDKVSQLGFDGIVFGGLEYYQDYECSGSDAPKACSN